MCISIGFLRICLRTALFFVTKKVSCKQFPITSHRLITTQIPKQSIKRYLIKYPCKDIQRNHNLSAITFSIYSSTIFIELGAFDFYSVIHIPEAFLRSKPFMREKHEQGKEHQEEKGSAPVQQCIFALGVSTTSPSQRSRV